MTTGLLTRLFKGGALDHTIVGPLMCMRACSSLESHRKVLLVRLVTRYAAVVVGSTLGVFAVVWLVGMMVLGRMAVPRAQPGSVQGADDDGGESARLVPGKSSGSPSAYSAIDG